MSITFNKLDVTWDDIPVGCFISSNGGFWYLKTGVERDFIWFDKRKVSLVARRGMHGSHRFNPEDWKEVSYLPVQFME